MAVLIRKAVPTWQLEKACQFLSFKDTPRLTNHLHFWKYNWWWGWIAFRIVTFIYTSLLIKKAGHLFPSNRFLAVLPPTHYPCSLSPFLSESKAKILYTYFLQPLCSQYLGSRSSWAGIVEALIYSQEDFGNVLPG